MWLHHACPMHLVEFHYSVCFLLAYPTFRLFLLLLSHSECPPFPASPPRTPRQVPTASSLIMMMTLYTFPLDHDLEIAPPTLEGSLDRTGVRVPILQRKKQVQVSSQSHVIGKSPQSTGPPAQTLSCWLCKPTALLGALCRYRTPRTCHCPTHS